MSDVSRQGRIEELLRKSLLGEELVNTQFHVFSARSRPSGRVLKPRVLCANNVVLAKSSKYFLDLLSSDVHPTDASLIDLADDNGVPGDAGIDAYGYASDSDLDECDDPFPPSTPKPSKDQTVPKDDDELSDDGSVSSDMFVMSPEQPSTGDSGPFSALKGKAPSEASSVTAVQVATGYATSSSRNQTAMRLRSLGSRHILVKDTAFQTWYALLNYVYTDKCHFLPLTSVTPNGGSNESSTNSLDEPRCSAKSMYRLASKVGLDSLRDQALSYIRSSLTEHNILKELSCNLFSMHPELLEMALDVLYAHIGSAPVVDEFPALARRIANKELPHGADIIIGIHTRLLDSARPSLPVDGAVADLIKGDGKSKDAFDVKDCGMAVPQSTPRVVQDMPDDKPVASSCNASFGFASMEPCVVSESSWGTLCAHEVRPSTGELPDHRPGGGKNVKPSRGARR